MISSIENVLDSFHPDFFLLEVTGGLRSYETHGVLSNSCAKFGGALFILDMRFYCLHSEVSLFCAPFLSIRCFIRPTFLYLRTNIRVIS